jgi:sulfate/thiosulfate-binding protein
MLRFRSLITATLAAFFVLSQSVSAATLLNVSYDPTREFYTVYNAHFAAYWKKKTGQDLTVNQSHGGSGSQARAVIEGLEADVVTLALSYDIDAISSKAKLIAPDWAKRLPDNSTPYTSTIVLLVRKGNPKHIRDWDDIVKPGVGVIAANPKTGGGARWNFLAAYSFALKRNHNDDAKARAFVGAVYKNVTVLDAAARASTVTFTERGIGDVLVAWENEAILAMREHPGQYQLIVPSVSILAEPPVAVVDANVAKHGTADVAKAYLEYLYTEDGQRVACKWGYRPRMQSIYGKCGTSFARTDLTTIVNFGGWNAAQAKFFSDGGVFDQIYSPR